MPHDFDRRDFLRAAAWLATGLGAQVLAEQEESADGIPKRPLGGTGAKVSILGIGGYHIGMLPEKDSIDLMHEAIDQGVTFFDNAWDYHDGRSEELMGKALKGRREKVFLMTKVCDRDYAGAKRQLDESLRRLQTDHLDLWQFHEINYPQDPEWVFERGGMKAALEAQKAGKIRFIGFTGHKDLNIHLAMLSRGFNWNTCQMPINVLDAHYRSFQREVVPVCLGRKIGVIGMKGLAGGFIPKETKLDPAMCRRYSLSLPISTLVCGMQSRENLRQDAAVARNFKPMSQDQMKDFLARSEQQGVTGQVEKFKTSRHFDSEYHQRQHASPEELATRPRQTG